ncbi:heme exporter protein D [Sphingobium xenophagum]|uniref:Heme exporter protein D n=1 Tax=Sphingobium xenophagum TaxID=121428 RepID=A0ABU1X259_SPHXE|nr:hypothetical protein [Sphingobium xenophagum]MDR7155646.1 heme exporter protein D [Sphingobium xenophagum]
MLHFGQAAINQKLWVGARVKKLLAIICLCLAACTQQGWIDSLSTQQEQAFVLDIAERLRAGQIDQISQGAEPELRRQLPTYIKQVMPMLEPVRGTFGLQTVNVFNPSGGPTTKTFILQGGSNDHWAIVSVVLRGSGKSMQLAGLNVTPFRSDPSKLDDFEIRKRGFMGYLWLAAMLASISMCLWATILIWRRRWLRRRWLWTLGSLFGFAGFGLNWSTGAWAILFVNVSFLGAQATKMGPYAPWILSFGIPVVALIVIVRWYRGDH